MNINLLVKYYFFILIYLEALVLVSYNFNIFLNFIFFYSYDSNFKYQKVYNNSRILFNQTQLYPLIYEQ